MVNRYDIRYDIKTEFNLYKNINICYFNGN